MSHSSLRFSDLLSKDAPAAGAARTSTPHIASAPAASLLKLNRIAADPSGSGTNGARGGHPLRPALPLPTNFPPHRTVHVHWP
jgi:hypothetical protein